MRSLKKQRGFFGMAAGVIGSALIGGAAGLFGQKSANDANSAQAARSMEFEHNEAKIQRQWQLKQSNSAHQRQVRDLKAAGLNPILSANAGASSPGGAKGSGAQAVIQNEGTAAMLAANSAANISLIKAQTGNIQAETDLKKAQLPKATVTSDVFTEAQKGTTKLNEIFEWFQKRVPSSGKDLRKLYEDYKWFLKDQYGTQDKLKINIRSKN